MTFNSVYIAADNIISSLGFTTSSNISNILGGRSGIKLNKDLRKAPLPFYASFIDDNELNEKFIKEANAESFTRLEKMFILSIKDALISSDIDITSARTLIILSSTKGNIDLLEGTVPDSFDKKRVFLSETARVIQKYFSSPNTPVVVCNGCTSGALGLLLAFRLIRTKKYDHIVVTGGDIISEFTLAGFQSFKALSDGPCKPFDKSRNGLNLGEGCSTIILTRDSHIAGKGKIKISSGATSNDANHISGPSRTGNGLYLAIKNTLEEASPEDSNGIGYISAHGTATIYNDEMESQAFTSAHLENIPVNSLKGYFGHTLGAAGLIESVVALYCLQENILFNTKGYKEMGVSGNINVIHNTEKKQLKSCLKTASGFGGCNAAILFTKNE